MRGHMAVSGQTSLNISRARVSDSSISSSSSWLSGYLQSQKVRLQAISGAAGAFLGRFAAVSAAFLFFSLAVVTVGITI